MGVDFSSLIHRTWGMEQHHYLSLGSILVKGFERDPITIITIPLGWVIWI